jgi:hypothetical protein
VSQVAVVEESHEFERTVKESEITVVVDKDSTSKA